MTVERFHQWRRGGVYLFSRRSTVSKGDDFVLGRVLSKKQASCAPLLDWGTALKNLYAGVWQTPTRVTAKGRLRSRENGPSSKIKNSDQGGVKCHWTLPL